MSSGLYSGVSGLALGTGLYKNTPGFWSGSSGFDAGFGSTSPYSGSSLYLDFLSGTLDSRITFSRGSQATLVDSTGKITYAPNNLLLYSEQFDNAAWVRTNATVNANATLAPDGTLTADKAVGTATSGFHLVSQSVTTAAATYIYSAYFKTAEYSKATLSNGTGGTWAAAFDLASGTVVNTYGASVGSASISNVGNGWFRCSVTFTATAATILHSAGGYPNSGATLGGFGAQYTGDGTSGVFIWGAQLEQVTYQTTPSTYTATTASAYYGPRFDYDPVTLAAKGLLIEEQRTNLLTYSDQFNNAAWLPTGLAASANVTLSPDGTASADKLTEDTSTGLHYIYQQMASLAAASYVYSFYVKTAGRTRFRLAQSSTTGYTVEFDLSALTATTIAGGAVGTIANARNGWYRCSMVFTTVAALAQTFVIYLADATGAISYTGDGTSGLYVYGAQLEVGSFLTSYIPTVASTVTRSADTATMTGTNFSSWYNQTQGTYVADVQKISPSTVPTWTGELLGVTGNSMRVRLGTDGRIQSVDGSVVQVDSQIQSPVPTTPSKYAMAYALNDYAGSANGGAVATDTSGTVPVVSSLVLGSASVANIYFRAIAYYNTRLPNSQLQTLTAPTLVTPLALDFTGNSYTVGY